MFLFDRQGESISFENASDAAAPLELLLLAGRPLQEPVARYGPLVMNTRDEIAQAVDDFRAGKMGSIAAEVKYESNETK